MGLRQAEFSDAFSSLPDADDLIKRNTSQWPLLKVKAALCRDPSAEILQLGFVLSFTLLRADLAKGARVRLF